MTPNADTERDMECVHDAYFCCLDTCEWPHCLVAKASASPNDSSVTS
jgi:hypothetical protein